MLEKEPNGHSPRDERDKLFQQFKPYLQQLAYDAIVKNGRPREKFIIFLIDAGDLTWERVLETLTPLNYDWSKHRIDGERQYAMGTVSPEIVDFISEIDSDIGRLLTEKLSPGRVRTIVMAEGGANVYHMKLIPSLILN